MYTYNKIASLNTWHAYASMFQGFQTKINHILQESVMIFYRNINTLCVQNRKEGRANWVLPL